MKARQTDTDVSVAKHIADAFGFKKGSQVVLAPVRFLWIDAPNYSADRLSARLTMNILLRKQRMLK